MASRPFAEISDQEIENVIEIVVPDRTKRAKKYGMKIFNGKIHVYMYLFNKNFFLPTKAEVYHLKCNID